VTKEERAARRDYRKAFAKALTAAARPTRFQTANGCLYDTRDGWFVAVGIALRPDRTSTRLVAHIKPMAIDPIFWEAMALGDKWRRPLWKRHLGLAIRDPPFAEIEIHDGNRAEPAAAHFLRQAETWAGSTFDLSLADYLSRCRAAEKRRFHYFAAIATTLLAMGCEQEALELCRAATVAGNNGGYRQDKRDFADRLAELIERR
jgi:hypothetical protein